MPPTTPSLEQRVIPDVSASRPAESLMAACAYFLPRVMFLNSRYAPQAHWGDVALVLRDFPPDNTDVRAQPFWDEWQRRWIAQGDKYTRAALDSPTAAGRARGHRGAAACYHWAEFMDFGDKERKLRLRSRIRDSFKSSLENTDLRVTQGELFPSGSDSSGVPYWLFLPPSSAASAAAVPCVIMSNGLDSMTEIEVLSLAEPYLERGIAALLFDGPGQGIHVGQTPLRMDMEAVVAALAEMLQQDDRIAGDRLAFFGVSFGGYFALRVAQALGPEFKCVVNISAGPRITPFDALPRRLKDDFRFVLACGEPVDMQARFEAAELDPAVPAKTQVLTVHGSLDDVFPAADVIALDHAWGANHHLILHEREAHTCPNLMNSWSLDAADWVASHVL